MIDEIKQKIEIPVNDTSKLIYFPDGCVQYIESDEDDECNRVVIELCEVDRIISALTIAKELWGELK